MKTERLVEKFNFKSMKKYFFSLLVGLLLLNPAVAFNLPQGAEILTSPAQIKEYNILGQVGQDGEPGSYLYGIKKDEIFGAYTPVTGYQSRTTQFISASATTIPVVSTNDKAGNAIVLSQISSSGTVKVYMNLAPGTSLEEPVICTGVTSVSWTGCTRGVSFQGSSEAASTSLQKAHNAGTPIIITNIGQFYNQYVAVDGSQIINGIKTFTSFPIVTSSTGIPSAANMLATKYYVDDVGAGGFTANNVSNTQGTFALGTSPETVGIKASSTQGAIIGSDGYFYQQASSTTGLSNTSTGTYIVTSTLVDLVAT